MTEQRQPEAVPLDAVVVFTQYIHFVSHDPTKNRHRFYLLSWQPTLDGTRVRMCTWGRLGTQGRARVLCAAHQPNAQEIIARIIRRRLQRGYQVTAWQ